MKRYLSEVLAFIYNIPSWKYYIKGGCYKFYLKLKKEFPSAEAYYNSDHVITKIDGNYYDSSGRVEKTNHISVEVYYTHEFMKKIFNI